MIQYLEDRSEGIEDFTLLERKLTIQMIMNVPHHSYAQCGNQFTKIRTGQRFHHTEIPHGSSPALSFISNSDEVLKSEHVHSILLQVIFILFLNLFPFFHIHITLTLFCMKCVKDSLLGIC